MGCLPWEIRVAFLGESQLRQSRATRLTVHAECFSVSIIHRTLTWTTGSSACARVNACDCTRGCTDTVRESPLKVDSGRKIPCGTGESNLRRRRAGSMLYQLSYIPNRDFLHLHSFSDLCSVLHILSLLWKGAGCKQVKEERRRNAARVGWFVDFNVPSTTDVTSGPIWSAFVQVRPLDVILMHVS